MVNLPLRRTNLDSPYVMLMPLHFLDPLQFQLQKYDCIIIDQDSSFAELALRGVAELIPWRGKFGHHDLFTLNEDYPLSYRDT